MSHKINEKVITIEEASKILETSTSMVREYVKQGYITYYYDGIKNGINRKMMLSVTDVMNLADIKSQGLMTNKHHLQIAIRALVRSRRVEDKMNLIFDMLGVTMETLGTEPEELQKFIHDIELAIVEPPATDEEQKLMIKKLLAISEEHLEVISSATGNNAPWTAPMQFIKTIQMVHEPQSPIGVLAAQVQSHLRNCAFMYMSHKYGERAATDTFIREPITSRLYDIFVRTSPGQ